MAKRKTTTSTAVKRKWNDAHYTRLSFVLDKADAEIYKAKCEKLGISFSEIPKQAILEFIANE